MHGNNVSCTNQKVLISEKEPTRLIGERINPTGKKKLRTTLKEANYGYIKELQSAIKNQDKESTRIRMGELNFKKAHYN